MKKSGFMMQIIEQTREEKIKMYMKLSKKELAEMLCECNKHLKNIQLTAEIKGSDLETIINRSGRNRNS